MHTHFRQDVGATNGAPRFLVADPCHLDEAGDTVIEGVEGDKDLGVDCKGSLDNAGVVEVEKGVDG